MGKTILEKMTFYDIVTLLVPGVLVCCAWNWTIFSLPDKIWWGTYIAQFGLILMIGLLLKSFNILWNSFWFRNNTRILLIVSNGETNLFKEVLCDLFCGPLLYLLSPLTGLICVLFCKQDEGLLNRYYGEYNKAYYNAYSGQRIELLESQVAFLQNWSWALVFCLLGRIGKINDWGWCNKYDWGLEWWNLALGIYVCIVAMFILQKKIYQVVWDNMEAPDSEKNESNPKGIDKKQKNPSDKERSLTIFFWGSTIVVLLMFIGFILRVGMNGQLSTNSSHWADFSTYIGAIGTMLFTAVYAYSFIKLQGAINVSNDVQETKNQLDKEKGEEQKIKKSLIFALLSIESSLHTCVEQMKDIRIPAKSNSLPQNNYTDIRKQLIYAQQNIDVYNVYYQNKAKSIFPNNISQQLLKLNNEMSVNIKACISDLEEWNLGKQPKTIRQMINANLLKTFNIAKNIEVSLYSSLL